MRRRRFTSEGEAVSRGARREKVERAQQMRANPTLAEAALWDELRRRQAGGWKFRRQHAVAGYIVDFYCASLDLAIEVDGAIHEDRRTEDARRSDRLAALGVTVIRFSNDAVLASPTAVAREVAAICERLSRDTEASSPFPRNRGKGAGG